MYDTQQNQQDARIEDVHTFDQDQVVQNQMDIIINEKIEIQNEFDIITANEEYLNQTEGRQFEKQQLVKYKDWLYSRQKFFLDWENVILQKEELNNQNNDQNLSPKNKCQNQHNELSDTQEDHQQDDRW